MNDAMRYMARSLGGHGFTRQLLDSRGNLLEAADPFVAQCTSKTMSGRDKRVYGREEKGDPAMGIHYRTFTYVQLMPSGRSYIGEPTPDGVKVALHEIFPDTKTGTTHLGCFDGAGNPARYDNSAHYIQEKLFSN